MHCLWCLKDPSPGVDVVDCKCKKMDSLIADLNNLYDDDGIAIRCPWAERIDSEHARIYEVDMAGIHKLDVQLRRENDVLTVGGKTNELLDDVRGPIVAKMENGLLTVTVEKVKKVELIIVN